MTECILGIDVGTSSVKAVFSNKSGLIIHADQEEYPIHYPKRSWAEQEPESWWEAVRLILKRTMSSIEGKHLQVLAVGVSSQAPVFIPIGLEGKPLDRAMIWMDRRAGNEADLLYETLGEERVIQYSRNRADPFYLAAKLLWFKQHKAVEYANLYRILQANGYINYKLTGQYTMDAAHASITQLYDLDKKEWAADVFQAFGLSFSYLPPVYESSAIIGEVTEEAAKITGLQPGIPVIAGTVDGSAAALAAGVIEPGIAVEMTGTSSVLLMSNNKGWFSPKLITMNHALPNQTLSLAAMSSTGASLKWFHDELGQQGIGNGLGKHGSEDLVQDTFEQLNLAAERANPLNDIIFLPYMAGERSPIWDTDARGVFFGLSLSTKRADLTRSIMEGAAYALRSNLEIIEQSGEAAHTFRLSGGTSKSRLWNQIKADVLNREIEVIEGSGGAPLGSAILAGIAVGFYPDPAYVLEQGIQLKQIITPSQQMHLFYRKKYEIFLELYEQTKAQFRKLSSLFKEENQ